MPHNPERMERPVSLRTLEEKVMHSMGIIKSALREFGRAGVAIAWTGGKDSTVMLWLYREVCREMSIPLPTAMFIDEGCVFDEVFALVDHVRKEWDVDVRMIKNTDVSGKARRVGDTIRIAELNERNRAEIARLEYTGETFPFEPESHVGNHLMKTVAMNVFIEQSHIKALSTAIRWDEQDARAREDYFSPRSSPPHVRIHPILHFRERDVWDCIFQYKIPFCSLYRQGYRSLGAKGYTSRTSNEPAWCQDLESTPERAGRVQDKEQIMMQLRSLGYM